MANMGKIFQIQATFRVKLSKFGLFLAVLADVVAGGAAHEVAEGGGEVGGSGKANLI